MATKKRTRATAEQLLSPRRLRLPKQVVAIHARPEFDSEGSPALGVWVILSDASTPAQRHPKALAEIAARIRSLADAHDEIPTPHVRFRLKSEQDDLDRACA